MAVRLAPLFAALASCVIACASAPRTPKECDAKEEEIDAYLGRVAARASNAMSPTALGRTEQVTVAFEISPSGDPERISVVSASTPVAVDAARYAVVDAGPYAPPPFSQKACLLAGRVVISLYSSAKCDERLAAAYVEAVSAQVQNAMDAKGIRPSASDDDVILRVDIARDGSLEAIGVQIDNAAKSGAAIAAGVRELSPFTVPDDLILECVADQSFFLWYGATPPTPL
jgi:hypothetical protein